MCISTYFVKIRHFRDIHQIYYCEVLDLFSNTVQNFVHLHASLYKAQLLLSQTLDQMGNLQDPNRDQSESQQHGLLLTRLPGPLASLYSKVGMSPYVDR